MRSGLRDPVPLAHIFALVALLSCALGLASLRQDLGRELRRLLAGQTWAEARMPRSVYEVFRGGGVRAR